MEIFSKLTYPFGSTFTPDIAAGSTHSPENLKREEPMQNALPMKPSRLLRLRARARRLVLPSLMFLAALPAHAQSTSDPWDNAVTVLKTAFTGTIATGLSLVAIVVGGLMFAYGEGQSKKTLAGIVFGVGMAIGAVNFMSWLFPS
jgi:type IV secretory pathway VirB2 component (pilin)